MLFDGRRIWSFDAARDTVVRDGDRVVRWPGALRRYLNGRAHIELREHASGRVVYSQDVSFGKNDGPIVVKDAQGYDLAVDHHGFLKSAFVQTPDSTRQQIVEALNHVLTDLREVGGLNAFLAFGCLLGAVRDGKLIGHDGDADLAYISDYSHPFDVLRESWRAEQAMRDHGWRTVRQGGSVFKVLLDVRDGYRLGIDIFASFHLDGTYYLTAAGCGQLDRSAIEPLSKVSLEGHEVLAPGDVEAFLAFTYGPNWRIPDPSFEYELPPAFTRRFSTWFAGARPRWGYWHAFYGGDGHEDVPPGPSQFAAWVHRYVEPDCSIGDVGAGTGRDAVWLAQQGHDVVALDFADSSMELIERRATDEGVPLRLRLLNLNDMRSTLIEGARLAHESAYSHLYARMLLDALEPVARRRFWRLASMSQRRGGLTFLEFRTNRSEGEPTYFPRHPRRYLDPAHVQREVASWGGQIVDRVIGRDLAPLGDENPEICRLIVRWS